MAEPLDLIAEFTKRCTSDSERNLLKEALNNGVEIDVGKRWEKGMKHHPQARHMAQTIGDLCWVFGNDIFCFKFGGDGDNGESLTYLLDIYFETQDKIKAKAQTQ